MIGKIGCEQPPLQEFMFPQLLMVFGRVMYIQVLAFVSLDSLAVRAF